MLRETQTVKHFVSLTVTMLVGFFSPIKLLSDRTMVLKINGKIGWFRRVIMGFRASWALVILWSTLAITTCFHPPTALQWSITKEGRIVQ